MNDFINFFDKIFGFIINIWDSFYQSVIYDDRYKFILEGLLNTIIIAFFEVIIGIVIGIIVSFIRNNYEMNRCDTPPKYQPTIFQPRILSRRIRVGIGEQHISPLRQICRQSSFPQQKLRSWLCSFSLILKY